VKQSLVAWGMPEICRFFGVVIRMFYDDHEPPHLHAYHQDEQAVFDFQGNILRGKLKSPTMVRLIRDWIDLNQDALLKDWSLAREGKPLEKIQPLK
jgi:hypothetical protein